MTNGKEHDMRAKDILGLVIAFVICQLAGVVGGLFTASSVNTWYATLIKPSFNPPNWLFSPVWVTLYCMMGIALFLVFKKGLVTEGVKVALVLKLEGSDADPDHIVIVEFLASDFLAVNKSAICAVKVPDEILY